MNIVQLKRQNNYKKIRNSILFTGDHTLFRQKQVVDGIMTDHIGVKAQSYYIHLIMYSPLSKYGGSPQ